MSQILLKWLLKTIIAHFYLHTYVFCLNTVNKEVKVKLPSKVKVKYLANYLPIVNNIGVIIESGVGRYISFVYFSIRSLLLHKKKKNPP